MQSNTCLKLGILAALSASAPVLAQTTSYALLTSDSGIAFVIDGAAQTPSAVMPITGVAASEELVAIDVRPQNGRLYALAHNPKDGSVRLYHLDVNGASAIATALPANGGFVNASGNPLPIFAQAFDIDFNPTVDRLRVVATNGFNFRINPNNGALIDGDFGNSAAPTAGVNPDGALTLSGNSSGAMGTAYTNNGINVSATTQYSLNHVNNALYIQNPPNLGTLTNALPIFTGAGTLDFSAIGSIDIEPGINVTTANMPTTGLAAAVLTNAGQSNLYRINLATGEAILQANVGGLNVVSVAVYNLPATANGLSLDGNRLLRFALASPTTTGNANITGVTAGERLVGIDMRPTTGQLFALGVDAKNDRGTLYVLEPQSANGNALATAVGTPGAIAYVDENGVAIDLSDVPIGIDFNPTVDRIRILDASGLNARANPITGGPVDGNTTNAGMNPDVSVQAQLGTQIVATAYTTSVPSAAFTTQYTLDQTFSRLQIQNPPNNGVQTMPLQVAIDNAPFVFGGDSGFDIPPGVVSASANMPVAGLGYFTASNTNNQTTLYELSLSDASVAALGNIGDGSQSLTGLAVYGAPIDVDFSIESLTVNEAAGAATIPLRLFSGGSVPVAYRTLPNSASAGLDFTEVRGTVLLNGNNSIANLSVPILNDALIESDETLTLQITGPFAGPINLTITIQDSANNNLFADSFE